MGPKLPYAIEEHSEPSALNNTAVNMMYKYISCKDAPETKSIRHRHFCTHPLSEQTNFKEKKDLQNSKAINKVKNDYSILW